MAALGALSQDAIVLQLRGLHSLRSGLAKAVAGDDFLVQLARLQLAYYGEMLQLVTGHFDQVAERLRELLPAKPEATPRHPLSLTGAAGGTATANVGITNPLPASARVAFSFWDWCTEAGDRAAIEVDSIAPSATAPVPPAPASVQFAITFRLTGLSPGSYVGEATVFVEQRPHRVLVLHLEVTPPTTGTAGS